jgi:hypothetical protein
MGLFASQCKGKRNKAAPREDGAVDNTLPSPWRPQGPFGANHAPLGDGTLGWPPARAETSLDTANTTVCATPYSFTCTTCAVSKPLKCVGEALL